MVASLTAATKTNATCVKWYVQKHARLIVKRVFSVHTVHTSLTSSSKRIKASSFLLLRPTHTRNRRAAWRKDIISHSSMVKHIQIATY